MSKINNSHIENLNFEILDFLPFPIVLITKNNSFYWLNHSAEIFFQSSKSILIDKDIIKIFNNNKNLLILLEKAKVSSVTLSENSIILTNPKFGSKNCSIQIVPLNKISKFNNAADILISFQENTFVEKIVNNNSKKCASLVMSKMSSVLAHEIKNPLAGIKGVAQLLEDDLPESKIEFAEMIVKEVDRITHLIDRIEKISLDGELKFSKINIHEILDHSIKITQTSFGKHMNIKCYYDPSLPDICADKELLIQCFINLLKNSSEACSKNGEITITTSYSMTKFISNSMNNKITYLPLQIEIRDNGIGIDDNYVNRVFEPFVSLKEGGSGLGLSMVLSVISDHGGTIELNSNPGKTCFSINLPLKKQKFWNKNYV